MYKILAIDDKEDNLFIIEELIEEYLPNCKVFTALTGPLGIELAKREKPDIILTDIRMPGMDGYEVCQLLKRDDELKDIPVIMVTAIDKDPVNFTMGLELGADAFLRKPIENEELVAQIKVALRIKKAEDTLRQQKKELISEVERTKKLYHNIFDNIKDMVLVYDMRQKLIYASPSCEDLTGYSLNELYKKNSLLFIHPDDSARFTKIWENLFEGAYYSNEEYRILTKSGKIKWLSASWWPLLDEFGKQIGVQGIETDITRKRENEQKLIESLEEKKLLLKEIHHRVKNNLQLINGLLGLQALNIEDPDQKRLFRESINRIHSISVVHELLYNSGNFLAIDFSNYVRTIANQLIGVHSSYPSTVHLQMEEKAVFLPISHAIPCGLIVNELITNSLKYAFSSTHNSLSGNSQKENIISIKLEIVDKAFSLIFRDNGIGLPIETEPGQTSSLGFQLIHGLIQQLNASYSITRNEGTEFQITFEVKEEQI